MFVMNFELIEPFPSISWLTGLATIHRDHFLIVRESLRI